MTNFTSIILVDQTPEDVLIAIGKVRGWWSVNIEGETNRLNGQFTHRDRYLNVTFKITQLNPQRIVWDIVNSHNNMFLENRHEWNATRISFDITPKAGKTEIKFTHQGLVPELECYKVCSKAWSFFITSSLKGFIEKGKAGPISNDYASYTTSITVENSPKEVYEAVLNTRGWWLRSLEGKTDKLNSEFKYHVTDRLQFHFRIIEMVPFERIAWLVVDQNFKNTEKKEWIMTTVLFEISKTVKGQTQLKFTHLGLVPLLDCFDACQTAWTKYVQISLLNLIKNGIGQPD